MSLTVTEQWSATLVEQQGSGSTELAPLAEVLRLPFSRATAVSLVVNRVPVQLALELDSGVVKAVRFEAAFEVSPETPPGPYLKLRPETPRDRRDKAEQLAVEVQVGVRRFDEAVFIDTNASEAEVRRVLARADTRAAVQRLLATGRVPELELTTQRVAFKLQKAATQFTQEELVLALEQLLLIGRGGGPRGEEAPRRGEGLEVLAALSVVAGLAAMLWALSAWGAGFGFDALGFLGMGAATTVLARPFVRPAVAGDSGSGTRLRSVLSMLFVTGGALGLSALLAFNALAGAGDPEITHGRVIGTGSHHRESGTWNVSIRWEDGTTSTHDLPVRPLSAWPARRTRQPGYFVGWGERVSVQP